MFFSVAKRKIPCKLRGTLIGNTAFICAFTAILFSTPSSAFAGAGQAKRQVRRPQLKLQFLAGRIGSQHKRSQLGFFGRMLTAKHTGSAVKVELKGAENGGFKPGSVSQVSKNKRADILLPNEGAGDIAFGVEHLDSKRGFSVGSVFQVGEGYAEISTRTWRHRPKWKGNFTVRYRGKEMQGNSTAALAFFAGMNFESLLSIQEIDALEYTMRMAPPLARISKEPTVWKSSLAPHLVFTHERSQEQATLVLSLLPNEGRTFSTDVGTFSTSFLHQALE